MGKLRWWPAAVIVGLGLLWLGRVWFLSDVIRQEKVVRTIVTTGVVLILLLLWLLLLSRLPGRVRAAGFLGFVLLAGGGAALFRIRGVTGDLVPILERRWGAQRTEAPPPPAAMPSPGSEPTATSAPSPPPALPVEAAPPVASAGAPAPRDYPQFLGPERNGVVRGVSLSR